MGELISENDFRQANAQGQQELAQGPRAVCARYEAGQGGRIVVELDNGCAFAFPVEQAQGLAGASAEALAVIEVTPSGLGLHWPEIDADLLVPALLGGVLGSRQWMAELGRAGGKSRSQRKVAAARANGKRGGRPPKVMQVGGQTRHIEAASGAAYLAVLATVSSVSVFGGVLVVEAKGRSSSPRLINAESIDRDLATLDPTAERIWIIREDNAQKRQAIVLDLEAGLTVAS